MAMLADRDPDDELSEADRKKAMDAHRKREAPSDQATLSSMSEPHEARPAALEAILRNQGPAGHERDISDQAMLSSTRPSHSFDRIPIGPYTRKRTSPLVYAVWGVLGLAVLFGLAVSIDLLGFVEIF